MPSGGRDSDKVAHHGLGGHDTKLLVPLLLALQDQSEQLLIPLDELESLLLSELEGGYLVVEHSNVLVSVRLSVSQVLHHVDLVAQGDGSEELLNHHFGASLWTLQDRVSFRVVELLSILDLVGQVVQRQFVVE